MAGEALPFRTVHLVGSIPFATVEDVFEQVGRSLGPHLRRIPDGELGPRLGWIRCQKFLFETNPAIEPAPSETDWRGVSRADALVKFRIKPAVDPASVRFGELRYAQWAIESYGKFCDARAAGAIPANCRFQVSLPTPYGVSNIMSEHASHAAIEAAYGPAMQDEIARLLAGIDARDLAIQWDVAQETECVASGAAVFYPLTLAELASGLATLASWVPGEAEVGFHFCYGDYQHKHFIEPTDTSLMVEALNRLWQAASRPIDFVHMPVPQDRSDDAYFRPLQGLDSHPETELYLGLLHFADGLPGAVARMKAAEPHLAAFGIGTECGFGRRAPETIPALLRLHAAAAGGPPTNSK